MTIAGSRVETANDRRYTVVSDGVATFSALITGVVADDLGRPLGGGLELTDVDTPGLRAWTGDRGQYGFAGIPEHVWPDLTVAHAVSFTAQARGYRARRLTVPIPPSAVFPVTAPAAALRRLPIRLQGTITDGITRQPIPAATVTLVPGVAPHPLLLRTPVAAAHDTGALQAVVLTPVALAPPPRRIVADAEAGDTQLSVNDSSGFVAGQLLRLGPDSSRRWVEVSGIGPLAGVLMLKCPLTGRLPATTPVAAFTAVTGGPIGTLSRSAQAGESVLLVSAIPAGDVLRLSGAPGPDEFFALGALADAGGQWFANGVSAPSVLSLQPAATGHATPPPTVHLLDFQRPVDVIDFELGP